jgi:hypothetical protein
LTGICASGNKIWFLNFLAGGNVPVIFQFQWFVNVWLVITSAPRRGTVMEIWSTCQVLLVLIFFIKWRKVLLERVRAAYYLLETQIHADISNILILSANSLSAWKLQIIGLNLPIKNRLLAHA